MISNCASSSKYEAIGLMSGTSVDGLDICHCSFQESNGNWKYRILNQDTLYYSDDWRKKLLNAHKLASHRLFELHSSYGCWIGECVHQFITRNKIHSLDLISSHGHTIFHNPSKGYSFQLGNPAMIAAKCNLPVITDFRMRDISEGGQGAPLVPIGDKMLFNKYEYCLNLGGFANISYDEYGKRKAFDICPLNIVLNHFSRQLGMEFDTNGSFARQGNIIEPLLSNLNRLKYYQRKPTSLSREWTEKYFLPVCKQHKVDGNDMLRTLVEHAAVQIASKIASQKGGKMLVTGGGTYNNFLVTELKTKCSNISLILPDKNIINYKEALIFAFLGILRKREEFNCLGSNTGAKKDVSGGGVHI